MSAAKVLLDHHDLSEISLHRIAAEAGIPPGSAYHFFGDANAVYAELARRFGGELIDTIVSPYSGAALESWQDLYREAAYRGVELYRQNPAYCPLILGSHTTPAIKSADRENDFALGRQFAGLLDKYFLLPQIEARETRMFYSIEIVDLFLSLSYQRHRCLEQQTIDEGVSAAIAYLRQFIPDRIPRRNRIEPHP